jgi:hypothetical protein
MRCLVERGLNLHWYPCLPPLACIRCTANSVASPTSTNTIAHTGFSCCRQAPCITRLLRSLLAAAHVRATAHYQLAGIPPPSTRNALKRLLGPLWLLIRDLFKFNFLSFSSSSLRERLRLRLRQRQQQRQRQRRRYLRLPIYPRLICLHDVSPDSLAYRPLHIPHLRTYHNHISRMERRQFGYERDVPLWHAMDVSM